MNNLRFADDLLLVGRNRAQVRQMLEDLTTEAAKVGLKLHMGKTKILSSRTERRGCLSQRHVEVLGEKVEILPWSEGTMYLGRMMQFDKFHDVEIDHRIRRGWAAFGKFKQELRCKHYPLKQRFKLFDATVSATVLYGSGTWCCGRFSDAQGRTRVAPKRKTWVEWIIRTTHKAESFMNRWGLRAWVETQQVRKHQLKNRIQNATDGRWSARLLNWHPDGGFRRVGRPCVRWTDC